MVTGDHEVAKRLMVEVGLFDPPANDDGKADGHPATDAGILDTIARKKGVTAAGFLAYGAQVQDKAVCFPMFAPDGEPCSTFTLTHELTTRGQRVLAMLTHAKILLMELTDGRGFTVESSANLRSCSSIEQITMTHDAELLAFHRQWITDIMEKR